MRRSDDGRSTDPESDRHRIDDRHHGLGESDGRDRVGAEVGDEEDVHDGEQRLEDGLEHHRHGQQEEGAADGAFREVLAGAADGFAERLES
jgi:hypothetical protein